MSRVRLITIAGFLVLAFSCSNPGPHSAKQSIQLKPVDSLPFVFPDNKSDLIDKRMRQEAALRFAENQLPSDPEAWAKHETWLRNEVITKAGVRIDHKLPVDMQETGSVKMKGYTIKNILYQTRPGVYATANLYVPDGPGPFPAVINMLGHWRKGKIDATGPQAVGHTLASSGFVCLTVDPWGAGERGTKHGDFEYHGSNLGASLMNNGEPLLGIQVSDNMRGVDLLCSLPFVDSTKIGATGASGGGNQTMWLSAVDTRIKADVPVVSVGTFESYIMESNCICEQLPDGLTFTEEAGIIALSNAPLLLNHDKDSNPTFFPSETRRTLAAASKIFSMTGRANDIAFRHFELEHGYEKEDREAMLGWFSYKLRGTGDGTPVKEPVFQQLPEASLMVFQEGNRDKSVISTDEYCRKMGTELRSEFLKRDLSITDTERKELKEILRVGQKPVIARTISFAEVNGWERLAMESVDGKVIPMLKMGPVNETEGYVIILNPDGKGKISLSLIDSLRSSGAGILIADLTGTGELTSTNSSRFDELSKLHTLSRAELWLGKTILGEWVRELDLISQYLQSDCRAQKISVTGYKEAGLAGLFYSALGGNISDVRLINAPVSYLFDNREHVDYFSMGIHLPGFLKWGDVSLAAALTGKDVEFIRPVSMSGSPIEGELLKNYIDEFASVRNKCGTKGKTIFN
jgi:hypothetical protein